MTRHFSNPQLYWTNSVILRHHFLNAAGIHTALCLSLFQGGVQGAGQTAEAHLSREHWYEVGLPGLSETDHTTEVQSDWSHPPRVPAV